MSDLRVTLLGTAGSLGVPTAGNQWGDCDPGNPRNRRRRPSALLQFDGITVLVDTSPDLRLQLNDAGVERLDAIIYTHAHADHVHGIDDLRALVNHRDGPIPAYLSGETHADLKQRFAYALTSVDMDRGLYRPLIDPREIRGHIDFGTRRIQLIEQDHYSCTSWGLRCGKFAYCSDVVRFSRTSFEALMGLDTLVIDATRRTPHRSHAHLALTLSWIAELRPRRAILTHMNVSLDYGTLLAELPDGVEPGFDGMVLDLDWQHTA